MSGSGKIDLNPAVFKRHGLFAGLSEEQFKELVACFRIKQWPSGGRIAAEGDPGGILYVIYQGGVDILKQVVSREGERTIKISSLHAGETFGEMALIDQQPWSASVVTNSDSILLALHNTELRQLDPRICATLMANLAREASRRLRASDRYFSTSLFTTK